MYWIFKEIVARRLRIFVLISFISLLYNINAISQRQDQFSGREDQFTKEIQLYFKSAMNNKNISLDIKKFIALWDSGYINNTFKGRIINIANSLINKKARPVPEVHNYLRLINEFFTCGHQKQSIDDWLTGMEEYVKMKTTLSSTVQIINNTYNMLTNKVLYISPAIKWKSNDTIFLFLYTDTLYAVYPICDLICYANRDSMIIFGTSGMINMYTHEWKAFGGTINWERAGFSKDSIYAKLSHYRIDLTKMRYKADSVILINKYYFDKPIKGHLENYASAYISKNLLQYPKFESYQKKFYLKNIYPNVDYLGGFSMLGSKIAGTGSIYEPATLFFYRFDTLRVKSNSLYYIFHPDRVISPNASITIYLEHDSIYHPALQFNYTTNNNLLSLLKSDRYTARSPYLNTYHNIDMNFDQLKWKIDEPYIYFTYAPGAGRGVAIFESINFFKQEEFEKLEYYDRENPLVSLKKFSKYFNDSRILSANDLANFLRKSIDEIHTLLFPLAVRGYILYDPETETIHLKDKLYETLAASAKRKDYDVIRFYSETESPVDNAILDLRNNDLRINGMPYVFVSDSQNVQIIPTKQSIVMKKNRSFQFDGIVKAGLFTFYGKNFFFNYDTFKISVRKVDSISLKIITGYDLAQKPILRDVSSVIYDATGDILVDDPNNKAGLVNYPQYPIFSSYNESYIYYDDKRIFNGVYDRRRNFYYKIDPYVIDSLDNFKKEALQFNGTFYSANIFDSIRVPLRLQKDFSLGLTYTMPVDGMPIYKGRGKCFNIINMSNQGLHGNGKIKYLSSVISSDDILLFPDSALTTAQDFTIEQTSIYPPVWGKDINILWLPYKDQLISNTKTSSYGIYNNQTTFIGSLNYTPSKLTGNGNLDFTEAEASSRLFKFWRNTIDCDTANFNIKSLKTKNYSFKTENVKAHIDWTNRSGSFRSNEPVFITDLPENKYKAKIQEFKWWMDKDEVTISSSEVHAPTKDGQNFGFKDEPLTGAKYVSYSNTQDSLYFVSPNVTLNYENNTLTASKVKYIDVADARIFPDKEQIIIEGENVLPISNSKILANRETRFHNFFNASVNIASRKYYTGDGWYYYIDENNKKQPIYFTKIYVNDSIITIAKGEIIETDTFTLNPYFHFQGDVTLKANEKYMNFSGGVKIFQNCPNYRTDWLKFESVIDPVKVIIPVSDEPRNINNNKVVIGSLITNDSIHIYSSFFAYKKAFNDSLMATSKGYLWYNKFYKFYEVTDEAKLKRHSLPGPMVAINPNTCVHYAEGPIRLGVNFGQCKILNAGNIEHNLFNNSVRIRLSMAIDFYFFQPSINRMAKVIDSIAKDTVNFIDQFYVKNLSNIINPDEVKNYYKQLNDTTKGKTIILPDAFKKTLFIDDITFVYDDSTRSFHSVGKIGIGFINGTPIHKYIDGYIEIWKRFSGDIIDILFYPDENTYFYFNYSKGKMETLSSDKVFEMPIHNLPERKRRMKTERGKPQYLYQISTMRKMSGVKTRWKTGLSDELKEFIETSTELEEIMIREDNNQNNGNNNEQE